MVLCRIEVACQCPGPGCTLAISGHSPALGDWDPRCALRLVASHARVGTWFGDVPCPGAGAEFKFLILRPDGDLLRWEPLFLNRKWPEEACSPRACVRAAFGLAGQEVADVVEIEEHLEPAMCDLGLPCELPRWSGWYGGISEFVENLLPRELRCFVARPAKPPPTSDAALSSPRRPPYRPRELAMTTRTPSKLRTNTAPARVVSCLDEPAASAGRAAPPPAAPPLPPVPLPAEPRAEPRPAAEALRPASPPRRWSQRPSIGTWLQQAPRPWSLTASTPPCPSSSSSAAPPAAASGAGAQSSRAAVPALAEVVEAGGRHAAVRLWVRCEAAGSLCVTGSDAALGGWDLARAKHLHNIGGNPAHWVSDALLLETPPPGRPAREVQYKFALLPLGWAGDEADDEDVEFEEFNRSCLLPAEAAGHLFEPSEPFLFGGTGTPVCAAGGAGGALLAPSTHEPTQGAAGPPDAQRDAGAESVPEPRGGGPGSGGTGTSQQLRSCGSGPSMLASRYARGEGRSGIRLHPSPACVDAHQAGLDVIPHEVLCCPTLCSRDRFCCVRFSVSCACAHDERVVVVGDDAALGSWDLGAALALRPLPGQAPDWASPEVLVALPAAEPEAGVLRFRLAVVRAGPLAAAQAPRRLEGPAPGRLRALALPRAAAGCRLELLAPLDFGAGAADDERLALRDVQPDGGPGGGRRAAEPVAQQASLAGTVPAPERAALAGSSPCRRPTGGGGAAASRRRALAGGASMLDLAGQAAASRHRALAGGASMLDLAGCSAAHPPAGCGAADSPRSPF